MLYVVFSWNSTHSKTCFFLSISLSWNGSHTVHFLFVYMVCVYAQVHVSSTGGYQRRMLAVLSYHSPLYSFEMGSLTEPWAMLEANKLYQSFYLQPPQCHVRPQLEFYTGVEDANFGSQVCTESALAHPPSYQSLLCIFMVCHALDLSHLGISFTLVIAGHISVYPSCSQVVEPLDWTLK